MASSEQTTKRHLNKPQPEDFVNVINDICDNMDNLDDAVPDSRKVNGHALNGDITVSKSDVGLGNVDNVQQVPATRKVNNKPLSSDINLQGTDIQVSSSDSRKVDAAIANCDSETASLKSAINASTQFVNLLYIDTSTKGVMKTNGTVDTSFSTITIQKYKNLEKKTYYLYGNGSLSVGGGYCYVWRVKNGAMVDYIAVTSNPQVFNYIPIVVDDNVDEIWTYKGTIGYVDLKEITAVDNEARGNIEKIPNYENIIFTNLFDPNDSDIETGGFYSNGQWQQNSNYFETGYIPVVYGEYYRSTTFTVGGSSTVSLYNENKTYVGQITSQPNGYIQINDKKAHYIRIPIQNIKRYCTAVYRSKEAPYFVPYGKSIVVAENAYLKENDTSNAIDQITKIAPKMEQLIDVAVDSTATGYLKSDGTIATFGGTISKYNIPEGETKIVVNGTFGFDAGTYAAYWFVDDNGTIITLLALSTNPQTFDNVKIDVPYGATQLWSNKLTVKKIDYITPLPNNGYGIQWKGKIWYAYGTSLTNIANEGKYATYLAQFSGMTLVNKGISGGGIGDLGGYSHGQVYDAICNITDGKLNADIITLETGANDIAESVPLGDVFDTGTSTLAGCLNDCIHYLQENTTAQICIIPSPCGKQTIDKAFQWAEMIRQICDINRVTLLSPNDNIGRARANSSQGSTYLVDNIHQTNLGGYVLAEYLWYQLRNVPCFYTSMPT